jgi:hypothetical protein
MKRKETQVTGKKKRAYLDDRIDELARIVSLLG